MTPKDGRHLPKPASIGEFGRTEFANGIADIRSALIDEAWFDRTSSAVTHIDQSPLGWERNDEGRAERRNEDPFGSRWSTADEKRQRPDQDRDHPQELDFDR